MRFYDRIQFLQEDSLQVSLTTSHWYQLLEMLRHRRGTVSLFLGGSSGAHSPPVADAIAVRVWHAGGLNVSTFVPLSGARSLLRAQDKSIPLHPLFQSTRQLYMSTSSGSGARYHLYGLGTRFRI